MMTDLEKLAEAKDKPVEVRIYIQKFGGKTKVIDNTKLIKRGGAPGFVEYEDVTEQMADKIQEMRQWFAERALKFAAKAGYIKTGE
jgi:hypothetical protein